MKSRLKTPKDILSLIASRKKPRPEIGDYFPPATPMEEAVAQIWSDVLRVDRIGRNDDLFDLGADSLQMTRIASRLRSRFEVSMSLELFFEKPTVALMAEVVGLQMSQLHDNVTGSQEP